MLTESGWQHFRIAWRLYSVILALTAVASTAQNATVAPEPAPVVLDKNYIKELGSGRLVDTIERRNKYQKAAAGPPPDLFKPYVGAAVGAPLAVELVRGVEIANAPAAQELCQSIVNKLLDGWKGPKSAITVAITAEPFYHGKADDTGLMLVSLGTFDAKPARGAFGVEELALLLGHELAHTLLGHNDSDRAMTAAVKTLMMTADTYLLYAQLNRSHMVGNTLQLAGDKQAYRQGLIGGLATGTIATDLLSPSFGRTKEFEADRLGIDLARRAGYLVTERTASEFIHHHRADEDRMTSRMAALGIVLQALNNEAAKRAAQAAGGYGSLVERLEKSAGDMSIRTVLHFIAKRNKDHPDLEQRTAFAAKYIKDNYPPAADAGGRRVARDLSFSEVAELPTTSRLLGHVDQAEEVNQGIIALADDPDGTKDRVAFDAMMKKAGLVAPPPGAPSPKAKTKGRKTVAIKVESQGFVDENAAYTWRMQGILQQATGNSLVAQTLWYRGLQFDYASIDMARRWARGLPPERRAAEVPPVIERYARRLGTSDPLLDLTVLASLARGDEAAAETAAAQCVSYDNGRLYPACVASLGYDPLNKTTPAHTDVGRVAFAGKSFEKNFQWIKMLGSIF